MKTVALALLLVACKEKSVPPATAPAEAPPTHAEASPALPVDAAGSAAQQPLVLEEAQAQLPKVDGDALIPLKATSDGMQAHATWCVAGAGADAVAESLAKTMTGAGYTDVATRGDSNKAGVSGQRDAWRLSYVVSASTAANCRAPGHYFASATLFRAH